MPTDIPLAPTIATAATYPAGALPWSGQPTKVTPNGTFNVYGNEPAQTVSAENSNSFLSDVCAVEKDAAIRAAIKVCSSGTVASAASHGGYLPITKVLMLMDAAGGGKVTARSPADPTKKVITATASAGSFEYVMANYQVGTVGALIMGGQSIIAVSTYICVQDLKARTLTTVATPHAGSTYTDGCMDVSTGRAVLLSAVASPNHGFASGNPITGLAYVAPGAGTGWVAATYGYVASKPGEVRAFALTRTFASADGGATLGAVATVVWTGLGGGAPASMTKPTWDARNARWVCTSVDTTSEATATASSTVWTSTDGVTWTVLVATPDILFTVALRCGVVYHRGWLWAIGVPLNHTGFPTASCPEVYTSIDGGLTWLRTGNVISMTPVTVPGWFGAGKILPMDNRIMFSVDQGISADIDYLIIDLGASP